MQVVHEDWLWPAGWCLVQDTEKGTWTAKGPDGWSKTTMLESDARRLIAEALEEKDDS